MENKKYLDKVIGSLVRGTKIDYEKKLIISNPYNSLSLPSFSPPNDSSLFRFFSYCKNIYGLTEDEIEYVWKEYKKIIKNKLRKGR